MKVKTDIETLKNVWILLKELELESIMDGGDIQFKLVQLIDQLFVSDKLNEFCQIVTGETFDSNALETSIAVNILKDFFSATATAFQPLVAVIRASTLNHLRNLKETPSGS